MNEVERVPSPPKGVVSMDESADATSEGEISSAPPALSPVAQPWKKRKTIAIALVAGVVCLLAYWKFATLRFVFIALLPYAPVIIPSLVALGTICFKDWNNYKPKWVRWVLVLLFMVACCFGIGYQITQRTEKAAASILNQANIDGLKGQVAMAQKAQDDNTKRFL